MEKIFWVTLKNGEAKDDENLYVQAIIQLKRPRNFAIPLYRERTKKGGEIFKTEIPKLNFEKRNKRCAA